MRLDGYVGTPEKPARSAGGSVSNLSEARTRIDLIEPALQKAGWDVHDPEQVGIEIPVDGFDPQAWKALEARLRHLRESGGIYDVQLPGGGSDYALYRPNGKIAAIVEAKRTSIGPRLAEAQAEFYVTELEKQQHSRPFAFMTNGHDVYFWDAGRAHKRLVAGFFSPADVETLLYLRENQAPLSGVPINTAITNRSYQQEAVRRVCEAFERGKRRALIVMATGGGVKRIKAPLPPLSLQQRFAHTVHQFERLRAQQREAERQAEHLFQTLLHRAFRRELQAKISS